MEANEFSQIYKNGIKIRQKSAETELVVTGCQNLMKQMLPVLSADFDACQKSLESYLEGKRNKFPRFYFTSDPVLLKILSQGSDPESIQDDFEKLFDVINRVSFDKVDKDSTRGGLLPLRQGRGSPKASWAPVLPIIDGG